MYIRYDGKRIQIKYFQLYYLSQVCLFCNVFSFWTKVNQNHIEEAQKLFHNKLLELHIFPYHFDNINLQDWDILEMLLFLVSFHFRPNLQHLTMAEMTLIKGSHNFWQKNFCEIDWSYLCLATVWQILNMKKHLQNQNC